MAQQDEESKQQTLFQDLPDLVLLKIIRNLGHDFTIDDVQKNNLYLKLTSKEMFNLYNGENTAR